MMRTLLRNLVHEPMRLCGQRKTSVAQPHGGMFRPRSSAAAAPGVALRHWPAPGHGRPRSRPAPGRTCARSRHGDPKRRADEDVARLDVAMDRTGLVNGLDPAANPIEQPEGRVDLRTAEPRADRGPLPDPERTRRSPRRFPWRRPSHAVEPVSHCLRHASSCTYGITLEVFAPMLTAVSETVCSWAVLDAPPLVPEGTLC
jgi:hypothetical protein